MSQLTAEQLSDVEAACKECAGEAAEAISRTLDAELTLSVAGSGSVDPAALPDGFDAAGLVVMLDVEGVAAVVVIAESTGLLPEWYADPDPTGKSKLTTMAQELGMTLLPEAFMPLDFQASRVEKIAEALARGGLAEGAASVQLSLQKEGGEAATAHLIFPLPTPGSIFADPAAAEAEAADAASAESEAAAEAPAAEAPAPPAAKPKPRRVATSVDELPSYAQSLLQIKVPVEVTPASKRQPLGSILELSAGTIIHFEKSCEELLELNIGEHQVGRGEAVKVGDKFGIRLTSIVLPEERFNKVVVPGQAAANESAAG